MMQLILFGANAGILAYGGLQDYNKHIIPDVVPICLVISGLFNGWPTILYRVLAAIISGMALLLVARITKSDPPGGDFKLLCTLTFSAGPVLTALAFLLTTLACLMIKLVRRKRIGSIPLCAYMAPSYLVLGIVGILLKH